VEAECGITNSSRRMRLRWKALLRRVTLSNFPHDVNALFSTCQTTIEMSPGVLHAAPEKPVRFFVEALSPRMIRIRRMAAAWDRGRGTRGSGSAPSLAQRCRSLQLAEAHTSIAIVIATSPDWFPAPARGSRAPPDAGFAVPVGAADCCSAPLSLASSLLIPTQPIARFPRCIPLWQRGVRIFAQRSREGRSPYVVPGHDHQAVMESG
jgi:hypothetical protein